jgi:hypothetical protein
MTGAMTANASPLLGRQFLARLLIHVTRCDMPGISRPPYPAQGFK